MIDNTHNITDDDSDEKETREIDCCPDCGYAAISARTGGAAGGKPPQEEGRYYCNECHCTFDTPAQKETYHSTVRGHGPASLLEDADPEEWP